jgi:outer membrane protein OmpA-like peptidoglycan-associated protein
MNKNSSDCATSDGSACKCGPKWYLPWVIGGAVLLFLLSLLTHLCSTDGAARTQTPAPPSTAAAAAATPVAPPAKLAYEFGQMNLAPPSRATLAGLLAWMKANPSARISLAGYFDKADAASADLAAGRAEALQRGLLDAGLSCDRVRLKAPMQVEATSGGALDKNVVKVDVAAADAFALPARVCFNPDKAEVAAAPGSAMAGLIDWMKADASRRVSFTVAADTGDKTTSEALAKDRAEALRAALTAAGISADRIEFKAPTFFEIGAKRGPDSSSALIEQASAQAAAQASAAGAGAAAPAAQGLPARVYYDSGKAQPNVKGAANLAAAIAALKADPARKATITGYTDKAGNLAANMELAKNRAVAVRAALVAAGIGSERIEMRPPESVEVGTAGADAEARRVEIK